MALGCPPYLSHATLPVPKVLMAEHEAWQVYPTLKLSQTSADALIQAVNENQAIPDGLVRGREGRDNPRLQGNLFSHGARTAVMALLMNDAMKREKKNHVDDPNVLAASAFLHDIAKTEPDIYAAISQHRKLDRDSPEWDAIKRHPTAGASIIAAVYMQHRGDVTCMTRDQIGDVMYAVRHHHERMDGKGYYRMPGVEIPLASRMIAVADAYDVIRGGANGGRVWQEPAEEPHTNAVLAELERCAALMWDVNLTGKRDVIERQFDPDVVKAFAALQPRDGKKDRHFIRYTRATGTDAV